MPVSSSELSEREREILRLVATGASNKEIAQQLFISANTVKVHLRNIFAKIEVASRTEAAMYAVNTGLVEGAVRLKNETEEQPEQTGSSVDEPPAAQAEIPPTLLRRLAESRRFGIWAGMAAGLLLALVSLVIYQRSQAPSTPPATAPAVTSIPVLPGWQSLAPMPTARYALAVVAQENLIYAIGGMGADGVSGEVEVFDPTSNSWDRRARKPAPVYEIGAVALGDKLYVPGGRLDEKTLTDRLEIYDPKNNTWEQGAPLPVPLSAYALAAFDGRMVVFGGWDGKTYRNNVYSYDPALDQWNELTGMPTGRGYAGAAIAGSKIYVIGGLNASSALSVNEAFTPGSLTQPWLEMNPLPSPRYGMGIAGVADIIFLLGGISQGTSTPFGFVPSTNSLIEFEKPPVDPLVFPGLISWEARIFTVGGRLNDLPTNAVQVYQLIFRMAVPIIR